MRPQSGLGRALEIAAGMTGGGLEGYTRADQLKKAEAERQRRAEMERLQELRALGWGAPEARDETTPALSTSPAVPALALKSPVSSALAAAAKPTGLGIAPNATPMGQSKPVPSLGPAPKSSVLDSAFQAAAPKPRERITLQGITMEAPMDEADAFARKRAQNAVVEREKRDMEAADDARDVATMVASGKIKPEDAAALRAMDKEGSRIYMNSLIPKPKPLTPWAEEGFETPEAYYEHKGKIEEIDNRGNRRATGAMSAAAAQANQEERMEAEAWWNDMGGNPQLRARMGPAFAAMRNANAKADPRDIILALYRKEGSGLKQQATQALTDYRVSKTGDEFDLNAVAGTAPGAPAAPAAAPAGPDPKKAQRKTLWNQLANQYPNETDEQITARVMRQIP